VRLVLSLELELYSVDFQKMPLTIGAGRGFW